ncbi:MAG: TolC family protein [Bacteroidales bacterium]|nr:TolC family protein [Bacteroidales bacterium]
MIALKKTIYILSILFIANLAKGQDNNLTLSSALEQALENNYGLIISRADVQVAEINNNWGTAGRYPTIGFDLADNNNYELNSSVYTNRLSSGIGLDWLLFDGFRVNITKSKLENLEDLSSGQFAVQVQSTIEDIILVYYSVLLQKEQLKVLETVMQLSDDRYQYELKKKSLGGSVTYNVLQAQNVYLTDKANFMNQEMMVRNTIRNLNFMMGMEPFQTWEFTEAFEADTSAYILADLLSKMKADNQNLKNQYTGLLLKENETSLQKSAFYPSVSLGAGMDYGHTWAYTGGAQSFNTETILPYGNVRLSFDIYSAGTRKRGVEIARINEDIAKVEIDQMEHALTNELFNLFDFHEVRLELLNVANENLEAAELNLSISEDKYRSGVINSFNYRDIQLIYLSVSFQRLQAVYNLIGSKAGLTRITGGFLGYASE